MLSEKYQQKIFNFKNYFLTNSTIYQTTDFGYKLNIIKNHKVSKIFWCLLDCGRKKSLHTFIKIFQNTLILHEDLKNLQIDEQNFLL